LHLVGLSHFTKEFELRIGKSVPLRSWIEVQL